MSKTENIQENKARFFALYIGSKVIHTGPGKPIRGLGKEVTISYETLDKLQALVFSNQRALSLRSIESLTDDELIHIAKLAYGSSWEDENCIASKVRNADNIHSDIVSIEIQTLINLPPVPKFYKCCHIQFDKADYDVNLYRFINDAKEAKDDIIGSVEQLAIADYLRSIGILIPWMDLSVEEIINRGWAVINNGENI